LGAERYSLAEPVNLGAGKEIKIKELVAIIARLTGFNGSIIWDASKPDGQRRRCLDVIRAKEQFGFEARMDLEQGLKRTLNWFINNFSIDDRSMKEV
jgi:GDP-L-fucose synthase